MNPYPGYIPMMVPQPYMVAVRLPPGAAAAGATGTNPTAQTAATAYLPGMTGMAGMSGMAGVSSMSGVSGMSSVPGMSGVAGMPGVSGMSGVTGMPGMTGMSGMTGVSGMAGVPGLSPGMLGMSGVPAVSMPGAMPGVAGVSGMPLTAATGFPQAHTTSLTAADSASISPSLSSMAGLPPSLTPTGASSATPTGTLTPAVTPTSSLVASPPPSADGQSRKRSYNESRNNRFVGAQAGIDRGLEEPTFDDSHVVLDPYCSDLNLALDEDGYGAAPLTDPPGFCFCWAGARATHGVCRGKVYYEVQVTEHLPTDFGEDHQETDPHILRVGWSVDDSPFQLGEDPYSYGYGGTAKFSTNNKFSNYGQRYGQGDIIGCLLDMDTRPATISYTKNGQWLGVAAPLHGFPVGVKDRALFPHILSKNTRFKVNFGQELPWYPPPVGFNYIGHVPPQDRVAGTKPPETKQECEMIMIVGLPGAGKTTWGLKMFKEHPEKKYNIIGTDTLIDKMKVMGLPRKNNYHGRWEVLIDKATKCLNKLFDIASKRRRNVILDQTNVYPSARKRKMRNFQGFYRRAVVIQPNDQELIRRSEKRTAEGKFVPESAVLEMKANFTVPQESDNLFDNIEFMELGRDECQKLIDSYRTEAQGSGYTPQSQRRSGGGGAGGGGFNRDNKPFQPPSDFRQGQIPNQYGQNPALAQGQFDRFGATSQAQAGNQYGGQRDTYGRDRRFDRQTEPPEKRARYDQAAANNASALDFIKQEYGGEEEQTNQQFGKNVQKAHKEQGVKSEPAWNRNDYGGNQQYHQQGKGAQSGSYSDFGNQGSNIQRAPAQPGQYGGQFDFDSGFQGAAPSATAGAGQMFNVSQPPPPPPTQNQRGVGAFQGRPVQEDNKNRFKNEWEDWQKQTPQSQPWQQQQQQQQQQKQDDQYSYGSQKYGERTSYNEGRRDSQKQGSYDNRGGRNSDNKFQSGKEQYNRRPDRDNFQNRNQDQQAFRGQFQNKDQNAPRSHGNFGQTEFTQQSFGGSSLHGGNQFGSQDSGNHNQGSDIKQSSEANVKPVSSETPDNQTDKPKRERRRPSKWDTPSDSPAEGTQPDIAAVIASLQAQNPETSKPDEFGQVEVKQENAGPKKPPHGFEHGQSGWNQGGFNQQGAGEGGPNMPHPGGPRPLMGPRGPHGNPRFGGPHMGGQGRPPFRPRNPHDQGGPGPQRFGGPPFGGPGRGGPPRHFRPRMPDQGGGMRERPPFGPRGMGDGPPFGQRGMGGPRPMRGQGPPFGPRGGMRGPRPGGRWPRP